MAPPLSVAKKDLIAAAIKSSETKPDLNYLAELFKTTPKTIRKIRDELFMTKVAEKAGRQWEPPRIGQPPKITPEIDEAIQFVLKQHPMMY